MAEPFVGAGIGYRARYLRALLSGEPVVPVLEVIPGHFGTSPELLEQLADRYAIVFHEVGLSLGTAAAGARAAAALRARMDAVRALAARVRPRWFTDHLALTCSPEGVDLGHLLPMFYTQQALALAIDRVRAWQDVLGVNVALENITWPFELAGADFGEAEFLSALVAATGCQVLLDLCNLLCNARNFGFDARARLRDYPLEAVVQVHLAGGQAQGAHHGGDQDSQDIWWLDSHARAVEDECYGLLAALRGRAAPHAIIVERDQALPELAVLVAEARHAERVWRGGGQ
jgi:uncharacterized protein (UPF0276 family)